MILVELDFPRRKALDPALQQQNRQIAQILGIRGYPTIWFATASKNGNEINFNKIGSTGYVRGGLEAWLNVADQILLLQE